MNNIASFLNVCEQVVGKDRVMSGDSIGSYQCDIGAMNRKIPAVLQPRNTIHVQEIVKLANEFQIPLYPISKGKNWGLGTALPVTDDNVVVDLSEMNRIREVNKDFGFAVIEPGVSQQMLLDYLRDNRLEFRFDVFGSSADASLLGNVVDGGVGYHTYRPDISSGYEIVLGTGELLQTGYSHYPNAKARHLFKYGVGPSLDGLFWQSNFGIVTAMGIELIPTPESEASIIVSLDSSSKLPQLVDAIAKLRQTGVIRTVPKIGNRERSRTTICPLLAHALKHKGLSDFQLRQVVEQIFDRQFGPWSAVIAIFGTKRLVAVTIAETIKALRPIASRIRVLTPFVVAAGKIATRALRFIPAIEEQGAILRAVEPLYNLSRGIPTYETLPSLYWPIGDVPFDYRNPERSFAGMLAYLPIIPAQSNEVQSFIDRTTSIAKRFGFTMNMTMSFVTPRALWGVIDIYFDKRDDKQIQLARECIDAMIEENINAGVYPQRVGIQSMKNIVSEAGNYWNVIANLKKALDPNGIIAPGRYCINR